MGNSRRQREMARQRYERYNNRQRDTARKRALRQSQLTAVAVLAVVLGGAFYLSQHLNGATPVAAVTPSTTGTATTAPSPSATVCPPGDGQSPATQKYAKEPALTVDKAGKYTMTIRTNCGTIVAALDAAKAPHTVNSFAFLASKGYFDHTVCHRMTTTGLFVLQCGDPTGTGSGGPGYSFRDENLPTSGTNNYPAGTLAMANSGAGTNGSQFFIVYADTTLGPNYTIFGHITSGLDVVTKVAAAGSNDANAVGDGAPNQPVEILSMSVKKQG